MYYVCMGCGLEWESDTEELFCPRCKVGDIYCEEESNDSREQEIERDVKTAKQTICLNNVYK